MFSFGKNASADDIISKMPEDQRVEARAALALATAGKAASALSSVTGWFSKKPDALPLSNIMLCPTTMPLDKDYFLNECKRIDADLAGLSGDALYAARLKLQPEKQRIADRITKDAEVYVEQLTSRLKAAGNALVIDKATARGGRVQISASILQFGMTMFKRLGLIEDPPIAGAEAARMFFGNGTYVSGVRDISVRAHPAGGFWYLFEIGQQELDAALPMI